MSAVKRFAASAQAHDVLQILKADGIVVIEGAAKTATLDSALQEIGPLADGQTFGLIGKSQTFAAELLMNGLFIDLTKRLLTDTCTIYYSDDRTVSTAEPQVSFTSALASKPGSSGWGLRRQDDCHHTIHPAKRETDFGIAYAATDITKDNGAIRAVIGSNMWKDTRDPTPADETEIELKKGDAILCLGSVFYGQKPNTTNEASMLLSAFTTPGWCRQEENQYLAIPYEIVKTLPKDVQRFVGYYVSLPYGGAVEHMEPLDFLAAEGDWTNKAWKGTRLAFSTSQQFVTTQE
ncbi:phytanoyl dioxygenase [Fusarium denticulatum]|uniref:Phytanoyl dioxygenase n=1 Tax=Fusarium denticulatum TaxID=48507 RepID=A0A8H5T9V7_9HYPO|nr:phytanoyl dioxygenase [Fusarium denticulatum]